jgi:hypothetical protein
MIIWKADYDGENIQADLKKLDEINAKIQKQIGGRVEGPYFPQDASILYLFHVDQYEWLNKSGRMWFEEIKKAGLRFSPKTYEVCVTPKEFFGTD